MQELAKSKMLRGDESTLEDDAQITADGRSQSSGKIFVELADGAQLFAANLSGLPDVPRLHHRARSIGAAPTRASGPYHVIDFLLV
jgi:hypothetical protein